MAMVLAVKVTDIGGVYRAKPGSRITDAVAQVAGPELSRLAAEGKTSTADIVDAARPDDAVLHPYIFRLSVEEAAEAHYRQEARLLANSVMVEIEEEDEEPYLVHAFPHVTVTVQSDDGDSKRGVYLPVNQVREEVDYRQQVLADFRRATVSFLNTWKGYARYFGDTGAPYARILADMEREVAEMDAQAT